MPNEKIECFLDSNVLLYAASERTLDPRRHDIAQTLVLESIFGVSGQTLAEFANVADEAFLVLRGKIALDFRDGSVELGEGDFMVVPKKVEHRPRSLTDEPIVLMFEPATTLNTGNATSNLTVTDLKRL